MLDFGFYNMDCLEGMKQFPDKYFDLAIVDPPYGSITGGYTKNQSSGGVARHPKYHVAVFEQEKPRKKYFDELFRVSKNQVIWGGNYFTSFLPESMCWVVWDKEKPEGVNFADVELAWTSFDRSAKIFHFMWNGMLQGDMKNKESKIHPTQKPVHLYKWLLNTFSSDGDIILDTHVGSASSLIACRETGHKYVGFEIDPDYYALAKERLDAAEAQTNIFDFIKE